MRKIFYIYSKLLPRIFYRKVIKIFFSLPKELREESVIFIIDWYIKIMNKSLDKDGVDYKRVMYINKLINLHISFKEHFLSDNKLETLKFVDRLSRSGMMVGSPLFLTLYCYLEIINIATGLKKKNKKKIESKFLILEKNISQARAEKLMYEIVELRFQEFVIDSNMRSYIDKHKEIYDKTPTL